MMLNIFLFQTIYFLNFFAGLFLNKNNVRHHTHIDAAKVHILKLINDNDNNKSQKKVLFEISHFFSFEFEIAYQFHETFSTMI